MLNPITETINAKEAVLFIYGNLSEVARQFAEMLRYCKRKNLHIVDVFFDTSNINVYQKECFNQMLDYLKHVRHKTAIIFYDNQDYLQHMYPDKLAKFEGKDMIEKHFIKDAVIM